MVRAGIKPSYKDFQSMKDSITHASNIENLYEMISDFKTDNHLPDSVNNFLSRVLNRLSNEADFALTTAREHYKKDQKKLKRKKTKQK